MSERELTIPELIDARKNGRLMSYSSVSLWQRCPLAWKFRYVDKIETVATRALLMGSLFDILCETARSGEKDYCAITAQLDTESVNIVLDRYDKYMHHIDYDNDKLQMLVYAPIGKGVEFPLYLHGYIDVVKRHVDISPDFIGDDVNAPGYIGTCNYTIDQLIDTKFCQKPVNGKAKDAWKQQARFYLWMMGQMGYDVKEFWFHVLNGETVDIDIIKYKPKQDTVDRVPDEVLEAFYEMKDEHYWPVFDKHCAWCDHKQACENLTTRRLSNETAID